MSKIKLYTTLFRNFIYFGTAAFLMKLFPQHNLKIRKWAARKSIPTFIEGFEIVGDVDETADLFISNHQNMVDIPIIEYLLPNTDLSWVAKRELGDIFLFGNLLTKSGAILIDREDKKSLIELLKSAKERFEKGQHLVIFPEGTRNKNPKQLLPFKAGAKLVAEKYNLRVQPVLLLGIDEIITFEPLKIKRGVLKVVFLKSREAKKGTDWYKRVEEEMQKVVENYYREKEKK
jgi:1-acyl-sn-glycerol-3-phosphate acyltransferase